MVFQYVVLLAFAAACSQAAAVSNLKAPAPLKAGPLSTDSSLKATAWYINGELCGNSNPLGYKDPATGLPTGVWAMDCDVKFLPTPTPIPGVPPGKRMWPPMPLYLNDQPIGTLCSFMQRKQEIDTIACSLILDGPKGGAAPTPTPTPVRTATPIPTPTPKPTPPNKCPSTCPPGKSCTPLDCNAFGQCYCK
jgi:hypothetical protein